LYWKGENRKSVKCERKKKKDDEKLKIAIIIEVSNTFKGEYYEPKS
jgi:hypothetical protein